MIHLTEDRPAAVAHRYEESPAGLSKAIPLMTRQC